MSNINNNLNYDGGGYLGHQHQELLERPMLSQSSSRSTQDTQSSMNSDYSNSMMMPQVQHPYHLQDSGMSNRMMSPLSSQQSDWWPSNTMMPPLDTSISMMGELGLSQSAGATGSPIQGDEYGPRRSSTASNPEIAEWQEKVRVERRKVQNRAAQRAYRERKEKAIVDLRDMLDKKETQYQALQADHKELQGEYEKLRASKLENSMLSMTTTCAPSDLMSTNVQRNSTNRPRNDKHSGD